MLSRLPGCIGARKMLASVGAHKHAILHEFVSLEMREKHFGPHEAQARRPEYVDGTRAPAAYARAALARRRHDGSGRP